MTSSFSPSSYRKSRQRSKSLTKENRCSYIVSHIETRQFFDVNGEVTKEFERVITGNKFMSKTSLTKLFRSLYVSESGVNVLDDWKLHEPNGTQNYSVSFVTEDGILNNGSIGIFDEIVVEGSESCLKDWLTEIQNMISKRGFTHEDNNQ